MTPMTPLGYERNCCQLRCQVSPGQFSSEFSVLVYDFTGREWSLFADRVFVHCDTEPHDRHHVEGWMDVDLYVQANGHMVRLPSPILESGQKYLSVKPCDIRERR